MKKLPKKLLTPAARADSQSGRGTSAEARPANYPSPVSSSHPLPSDGRGASPQSGNGQIPAEQPFLDKKTVGRLLMLSPRTVSEMANEGRLPAYRIGIYLRFKWADIDQFITANCKVAKQGGAL